MSSELNPSTINSFKWLILQGPCGCQFNIPQNNETEISSGNSLSEFKCGHGNIYYKDDLVVVGVEVSGTEKSEK